MGKIVTVLDIYTYLVGAGGTGEVLVLSIQKCRYPANRRWFSTQTTQDIISANEIIILSWSHLLFQNVINSVIYIRDS